jgi:hypothetical protein
MQQIDQAEEIIYLQEGWERIDKVGIQPFLHRVEIFDTDELDKKPNPMQEFLSTYDTVTFVFSFLLELHLIEPVYITAN